jgi:hypothetical protein
MREEKIGKHKVVFHDDIEQMSINQFNKVNKYWMLSDSLGSDFADIDKMHLSRLMLVAGDKDKTVKEINNLRILVNNIITEVSLEQLAFVALIHSIDGRVVEDYSEDNLKRLMRELPLKVSDVKKKRYARKSTQS